MNSNFRLADSSSAETGSAPKIFVDDSRMPEESRFQKKNFQKQILWVSDTATAAKLEVFFDVVAFDDDSKITPSRHYLIVERHTPESDVKAVAWKLLAAGINCKVYQVQTSLEYLLGDEAISVKETILQITGFALPFEEWTARTDDQQLTTREAVLIAKSAIALLKKPQKSVELATLRKRCNEAPYNWNKLMGTLEEEFHKELYRRQEEQAELPTGSTLNIPDTFEPDKEITQKAFQTLYGEKRWICANDKLYCRHHLHYEHSPDAVEIRRIRNFCNAYPVEQKNGSITYPYANPSSVEKILKWVKMSVMIDSRLLNPPGINCTNGVLQPQYDGAIPSWQLVDHSPEFYYTYPPIATYDPNADSTHCDRLLEALDPQQREIFLKTIAASLDLATVRKFKGRAVRALLLKGDGSNGKDSLREVVSMMFGKQGMTACTLSDFLAYDEGRKFPLAKLIRSSVNWASENTNTARLDKIQSLKAFITGDPLDAERKGVDAQEFTPMGIAIFNVNDTPNIQGTLEAITSRYGVLEFNKTFKIGADLSKGELEADPRFKYDPMFMALMVVPAFLNYVLQAFVNLMRDGIDYSCTLKTLENIQAENSHLFQFCQDVGLGYNSNSTLTANELWTVLEQWYCDNGTLDYEETSNRKEKAIWVDQARPSDKNVKAPNQIIPRFLQGIEPRSL